MIASRTAGANVLAWTFVTVQMLLLAALTILPFTGGAEAFVPTAWIGYGLSLLGVVGAALAGRRLGRGLTASPLPNANAQLQVDGPYAWVRHPIYTAVLLFGLGRVVGTVGSTRLIWSVAGFAALVAWLVAKSTWEEARLRERFPGYDDYASGTARFVPRIPRSRR